MAEAVKGSETWVTSVGLHVACEGNARVKVTWGWGLGKCENSPWTEEQVGPREAPGLPADHQQPEGRGRF